MLSNFVVRLAVESVGYGTLYGGGFVAEVGVVVIFWARTRLTKFRVLGFC